MTTTELDHAVRAPSLPEVTLDDKYTLRSGSAFLTGMPALTRLPLTVRQRDAAAFAGCSPTGDLDHSHVYDV